MMLTLHTGEKVSIEHLAPQYMKCPCDIGRDLTLRVIFSNPCYTEAFNPVNHTKEQIILYDSPKRPRVFCAIRHAMSYRLPEIISVLPMRKVHQTPERRNYVYVMPLGLGGQFYEIYFMLQRAQAEDGADLRLTIESAYPVQTLPVLPRRPNSIRFRILAHKVLMRQPIRFAAR